MFSGKEGQAGAGKYGPFTSPSAALDITYFLGPYEVTFLSVRACYISLIFSSPFLCFILIKTGISFKVLPVKLDTSSLFKNLNPV